MTSPEKWKMAEKLASKLEIEHGSDLAKLVRMDTGELSDRIDILEGNGAVKTSRRKMAGSGLRTVEEP